MRREAPKSFTAGPRTVLAFETFRRTFTAPLLLVWIALVFFLALNLPVLTLLLVKLLPPDYTSTNLPFFIAVSFPSVPLLPLVLGSTSITEEKESGTLQLLLSNPIDRSDYFIGRWTGLVLATSLAVVLGYGAAAVFVYGVHIDKYAAVITLILIAVGLNVAMAGLALTISVLAGRKTNAMLAGIIVWFLMTILFQYIIETAYDLSSGAYTLVSVVIIINPAAMASILAGLVGGNSSLAGGEGGSLGSGGAAITETLTNMLGKTHVYEVLVLVIVAWSLSFFAAGYLIFTKVEVFQFKGQIDWRKTYPHLERSVAVALLIGLVAVGAYIGVSSVVVSTSPYPATVSVSGTVNPVGYDVIPLSIQFLGPHSLNFTATVSAGGGYHVVLDNRVDYNVTLSYRDIFYDLYYCSLSPLDLASHSDTASYSDTCPSAAPTTPQ